MISRPILATAVVGGLLAVGAVDYVTDFDLLLSFFYLAPVALCAWHFGRPAVVTASVGAGVVWFLADLAGGHAYPAEWFRAWDASMCAGSCLVLGLALHHLKISMDRMAKANADLSIALVRLDESTREVRRLMEQLQVICAWTQRIRIDGKWMNLNEFLSNHLKLKLSHGISPEAFAKMMAEIERQPPIESK